MQLKMPRMRLQIGLCRACKRLGQNKRGLYRVYGYGVYRIKGDYCKDHAAILVEKLTGGDKFPDGFYGSL